MAAGAVSTNGASKLISSPPCASSEPLRGTRLPGEIEPAKGHTPGSGLGAGACEGVGNVAFCCPDNVLDGV